MKGAERSAEVIPVNLRMMTRAYLIRHYGTVLVDTGYPGSEDAILGKMQEFEISPEDLVLILITHGHADHAGSAKRMREKTGAKVVVHQDDADKLRAGRQGELRPTGPLGWVFGIAQGRRKNSEFPALEPDILISDTFDLHDYGVRGEVVPTPGHTKGSVSILLGNGDAFVGDLIFPAFPSGRPTIPYFAENLHEVKESIRKVMAYQPKRIFPGHGGPCPAKSVTSRIPL